MTILFKKPLRIFKGLSVLLCALAGCTPGKPPAPESSGTPIQEIEIRLLVVDDPAIAASIANLRSEWKARTGATISIAQISGDELIARLVPSADAPSVDVTTTLSADAILYPAGQLGLLVQRQQIGPLGADSARHQELARGDTFELLQAAETTWGQVPYAITFGSPVLTVYYRPDLFEQFHKQPPRTWPEYHALAEFFNQRENLGNAAPAAGEPWFGAVEPLAPGWAGRVLLARAAAYAKHHDYYSALFSIDTMAPLIDSLPFVRALEELAADAPLGSPELLNLDPAAARREFLAGHAALALSWPSHAGAKDDQPEGKPPATGFAELPGSTRVFNPTSKTWENRDERQGSQVTLLGLAGRLGSVTAQAAQPDPAFQLLAWLSGQEWGSIVSSASPATTLYRRTQLRTPQQWVDPLTDAAAARQYAQSVRDALSRQDYLYALRIAGQEKYLSVLDAAVEQVVREKTSPAEALREAAGRWRAITDELGLDAQRAAYRLSLGLEP